MKYFISLVLLFFSILISYAQQKGKYDIKSCKIVYAKGATRNTEKRILYIQDYGNKERWEVYDADDKLVEVSIHNDKKYYKVFILEGDTSYTEVDSMNTDIPAAINDKPLKTLDFLGRECSMTPVSKDTGVASMWNVSWNRIHIMTCIPDYGVRYIHATSIDEDIEIPLNLFLVLSTYKNITIPKKYNISSAILTYDVQMYSKDGKVYKEKWVYYFKEYGNKQYLERYRGEQLYCAELNNYYNWVIWPDKKEYDYKSNQVTLGRLERVDSLLTFMDYKRMADEKHAEKNCEVYQNSNSKVAGWEYICLFWQEKEGTRIRYVQALSIQQVSVPDDIFNIPSGYIQVDHDY